ncbi:zinc transporter ZntB [Stakelama tenebrarum]|uniref:Zinc transporter ZntB n=1 Tax=Stakelama tenebrarum TaxID=2711215 RepID=A0A6G6Y1G4_9SPHN|nr:zinc transporter ZntB [Sphingosinithalassobacter tenebrarum]QIG78739.1 zinc transporter ZntB [Sphingosinithalassobacter tenebrarum]
MSGFAYVVGQGQLEQLAPKAALDRHGDLRWFHLTTNDDHAKAWLSRSAHLPPFVVDALTATETRPRCDAVGDGAVINLRGLSSGDDAPDWLASVRIFVSAGNVYSVTRLPLSAVDTVRGEVETGTILDPGDLVAAMAQAITAELDPMVADLGDQLDDCEESLDMSRAFELRRAVNETRIQAIGYRRFLAPQRAALEKLGTLPQPWLRDDDRLHLAAAADRAARMAEELESIRERAALMHESLTDLRAEQLDQRSLMIAIVAMIFLPLTFLTGLLGMNVDGIPYAHREWAFWGVVGVCAVMALAIAAYFIRRHWFRR